MLSKYSLSRKFFSIHCLNEKNMFLNYNIWKKFDVNNLEQVYTGFSIGTHYIFVTGNF
jgi:hypothetical protein